MNNYYNKIASLCQQSGITIGKMCSELGMRPSMFSDLKSGRTRTLSAEVLSKIALYFSVPADSLLSNDAAPLQEKKASSPEGELAKLLQEPLMEEIHEAVLKLSPESRRMILAQIRAVQALESESEK